MGRPLSDITKKGMHRCFLCRELKFLEEFYKDKTYHDGYGHRCKACNKEYKKNYHKEYHAKEETKQKKREYYRKNRDWIDASNKKSREKHKERWAEERKNRHAIDPIPNMLQTAKRRARERGLDFNITSEDLKLPEICPALGVPIKVTRGKATPFSPSLDRVDNTKGYIKGNVVIVSYRANTVKNDASIEELRKILKFYEGLI